MESVVKTPLQCENTTKIGNGGIADKWGDCAIYVCTNGEFNVITNGSFKPYRLGGLQLPPTTRRNAGMWITDKCQST